jgi:hypothetical protein
VYSKGGGNYGGNDMLATYITTNGQAVTQAIMDSGSVPQFEAIYQVIQWSEVSVTHYNFAGTSVV